MERKGEIGGGKMESGKGRIHHITMTRNSILLSHSYTRELNHTPTHMIPRASTFIYYLQPPTSTHSHSTPTYLLTQRQKKAGSLSYPFGPISHVVDHLKEWGLARCNATQGNSTPRHVTLRREKT
jgi:hypothetical protein